MLRGLTLVLLMGILAESVMANSYGSQSGSANSQTSYWKPPPPQPSSSYGGGDGHNRRKLKRSDSEGQVAMCRKLTRTLASLTLDTLALIVKSHSFFT